ncbi:MAG: endonuclease V [candidate division WOR-3 bacterium]
MDFEKLREIQRKLSKKVRLKKINFKKIRYVGACDVSYKEKFARGAIVLYDLKEEKIIYEKVVEKKISFPYVPTFLSFREIPVLEELYKKSPIKPDVLFIDGQGILHPFKLGLASHFGVLYNIITIGIAKNKLEGEIKKMPEKLMKAEPVYMDGKISGFCLKLSKGKKYLWISPGNLITPREALHFTLKFIKDGCHFLMKRADILSKKNVI